MKNTLTTLLLLLLLLILTSFAAAATTSPTTLRPGDEAVSGAGLEPFHARYQTVQVAEGQEQKGHERFTFLQPARFAEGEGLRLGISMMGQEGTVYDEVFLLRESLAPVMRIVSSLAILHQVEVFNGGTVKGATIAKDGSSSTPLELETDGSRFAGGSLGLVLAGLPLKQGWEATFSVFSSDMGPQGANLLQRARVTGRERVSAAGREFDTWVVEVETLDAAGKPLVLPGGQSLPKATQWLADRPPYMIRSQWGPAQRVELVELR